MTTIVKVGRKKYRKFLPNMLDKVRRFDIAQENMWMMVQQAFRKFEKTNRQELKLGVDCLEVETAKEIEILDDIYSMEWLIVNINAPTYERELKEYKNLDKFEDSLKDFYEKSKKSFQFEKPNNLFSIAKQKLAGVKESLMDVVKKGVDYRPDQSISSFMLDLDIIMVKYPPKKLDLK